MKKKRLVILIVAFVIISIILSFLIYSFIKDPSVLINDNSSELSHIISYSFLSIIQILFPIIPGEPIELLAGFLFGKLNGTIICIICESLGSIIVVILIKKLKNKFINLYFDNSKLSKLNKLKQKKYFPIFALFFILPGTPKDLLCYFAGIADYDLFSTLIIVTIGRIPAIITSTLSAGLLKEKKIQISIIIYLATILICLIDIYVYKKIIERKEKN